MILIPNRDKRFVVDNSSFTKGNTYGTFNVMFDKDIGRIGLNPPISRFLDTATDASFVKPFAFQVGALDSGIGTDTDFYILTYKSGTGGYVWSTYASGLTKLTGTNAPTNATDTTSDMCSFGGYLCVSDADGLHRVAETGSRGNWTLNTTAQLKGNFILVPFTEQNRLYLFKGAAVYSCDSSFSPTTSGAYTITTGLSNITCARAASKRIWFASSGANGFPQSKIYEWDGVQTNPLNIFTLPTSGIQNIVILNDMPIAVDLRGRLWFYDGYQFNLKPGVNFPSRDDEFSQSCNVHRNGSFADGGKAYFLVSAHGDAQNSSERALAGIWCYDPAIGLYHFSSPDNNARITDVYALAKYTSEKRMIAGYLGSTTSIASANSRVSVTENAAGLTGAVRTGFFTTQFMESQNLTDMWNAIAIKYRKMVDPNAVIEVKYRFNKNVECNTTITWTSATTFTCPTADLAGTGTYYNTPVVVGDEVFVQQGVNTGLIAHISSMVDAAGTTTVTIDRSATTTSGTAYAMFSNYTLLKSMTNDSSTFKNIRLGKKGTMIQVKIVMKWKGYYDELQEIVLPEQAEDKAI